LLTPHFLNAEELIYRAHQNDLLQFGHMLVTLCTALLIVIALHSDEAFRKICRMGRINREVWQLLGQ
jgi:hypothetical protein